MPKRDQHAAVSEHEIALKDQSRRRFGRRLLVGLPLLGAALAAQQAPVAEAGSATDTWRMEGNSNVDSNDAIGSRNNIALRFITNNSERLRIAANGNIGAGTANPTARMQIVSSQQVAFRAETSSTTKGTRAVLGVLTAPTVLEDAAAVKGVVEWTGSSRNRTSYAVQGEHRSASGIGVYGIGGASGVRGFSSGGVGVIGVGEDEIIDGDEPYIIVALGILGIANGTGEGVLGQSAKGTGVVGQGAVGVTGTGGPNGAGVRGLSDGYAGVEGDSRNPVGSGVLGVAEVEGGTGAAIFGRATSTNFAGRFEGKVQVNGTLSKSAGSFKIDHPLDPQNKYLSHSFVESPDMMNVYNGNVVLDAKGEATVTLPSYFEVLNRDFRYQLTPIGAHAPLYIAEEVRGNTFKIAGGTPGLKVSWQITGVRQDAYAKANPIVVEEDKPAEERGSYLQPEAHGQPTEKGIAHARAQRIEQARAARPQTKP